jgi:hypothetical protein
MNSHLAVNPWSIFEFSTQMDLVRHYLAAHVRCSPSSSPHSSLASACSSLLLTPSPSLFTPLSSLITPQSRSPRPPYSFTLRPSFLTHTSSLTPPALTPSSFVLTSPPHFLAHSSLPPACSSLLPTPSSSLLTPLSSPWPPHSLSLRPHSLTVRPHFPSAPLTSSFPLLSLSVACVRQALMMDDNERLSREFRDYQIILDNPCSKWSRSVRGPLPLVLYTTQL